MGKEEEREKVRWTGRMASERETGVREGRSKASQLRL